MGGELRLPPRPFNQIEQGRKLTAFRIRVRPSAVRETALKRFAFLCLLAGAVGIAFAHLPASFSSVSLLTQSVVVALLAWLVLHEPLHPLQALGGMVVLTGIAVASRASR